jgi:membrane protein DedA with SNARE-associated domain
VEQFLINLFDGMSGPPAYGLVFGVLIACGMGVPLPEDVSLILGGFLAYEGKAILPLMMLTGYVGILAGDTIVFTIGRQLGTKVGTAGGGFFARIITPEKRKRVERLFRKHGEKIVLIARFLPGVRAMTYFTAGSVHMKYSHFIFFDGIAALVSAPVFVFLGYRFGGELETLILAVRKGQTRVIVGLVVVVCAYLIGTRLWNRWRLSKRTVTGEIPIVQQPIAPISGGSDSSKPPQDKDAIAKS